MVLQDNIKNNLQSTNDDTVDNILDTVKVPKQGPIGIHQVFPYPDFDPVDEGNIDSS